jgi:hypothetical protein
MEAQPRVATSNPSALTQMGATWVRNVPEDISEHEDSVVLRSRYTAKVLSLNPTTVKLEGRVVLGENSGTSDGLRDLFSDQPTEFIGDLLKKLSGEGSLFASGEAVFTNGHWESIEISASLDSILEGTRLTADPHRTFFSLKRQQ